MKWALIGASTIADNFMIDAIRSTQGDIAIVMSGSDTHAGDYAKKHGIPRSTTDLSEAVSSEIDAVYISSTNEKHFPQAMLAIDARKHVLCEKPLAMTVGEAAEMVTLAQQHAVVFATNHHLRCSGSHQAIRRSIENGAIGKILSVRVFHAVYLPPHLQGWRIHDPQAGGGVIADITVHDADVVRFITGAEPVSVVAQSCVSGLGDGVEDSAMSVWELSSGAMVMCHESFTHTYAGSGLEVHGTKGSIIARHVMTQHPVGEIELVNEKGCQRIAFSDHNLYHYSLARFTAAVEGGGVPACSGWDGVKSLAIAEAVKQAANTGQKISIDYTDFDK